MLYTRRACADRYREELTLDLKRLQRELAQQRRREFVYGADPLDAVYLRKAHRNAVATTTIAEETPDGDGADHAAIARTVGREVAPYVGALYLEVIAAEAEAKNVERRLLAAPKPSKSEPDELALLALFGRPQSVSYYGDQRQRAIHRIGGHLLAVGVRPGIALALLESWDQAQNQPPLERLAVETCLRWVARKQTERLRGAA